MSPAAQWVRESRTGLVRLRREAVARGPKWVALQAAITLGAIWLLVVVLRVMWAWASTAAQWGVVAANLRLFAIGPYTRAEAWRPPVSLTLLATLAGVTAGLRRGIARGLATMLGAALAIVLAMPLLAPGVALIASSSLASLLAGFGDGASWIAAAEAGLAGGWIGGSLLRQRTAPDSRARRRADKALLALWLASLPIALAIMRGAGDSVVPLRQWGGLLLTLLLASTSLALAFPLGIVLALGRRSSLPLVRVASVLYIELIRGVPLVTVLYMASLLVPLIVPEGIRPENVVRAMAGFALFTAAYVAEDVRGGLAALGRGQYEAARAVGLGAVDTYRLVILPQAIRIVIPSLVGHFISLFKDTSLVVIIGLRELLGIAQAVVNQPEWLGYFREALVFIALIYFVFSYAMSRTSRRLETRLEMERL